MAGNHTGSSLSPMSYWPACPLPFLKACTWVRHFFLSKFTSSICIQWMCVGFYYGCNRVYVYDGINNIKSIFSIFSVPFYKVHERLTETMKHVSGVQTFDTRTFSLFFLPFHVFCCIRHVQFVIFCYYIFVCLLDFFTHYWVIAIFFIWVLWNSLKACMW